MLKNFNKFILITALSLPLFAELGNQNYYSVYRKGFNQQDTFYLTTYNNKEYYKVVSASGDASSAYTSSQMLYANNFRVFLPKFTKGYDISIGRVSSIGWIDIFVALGKTPYLGDYQGDYTVALDAKLRILDEQNKLYFNLNSNDEYHKYYGAIDGDETWFQNLYNGWTLRYWNKNELMWRAYELPENISNNLNKWLYVATDDRPWYNNGIKTRAGVGSPVFLNRLTNIAINAQIILDKSKVDNEVALYDLQSKPNARDCITKQKNVQNACFFIRAFGGDGTSQEIASHSQTSEGYTNNLIELTKKDVALNSGWNLVGPHGGSFAYSPNEVKSLLTFNYFWYSYPVNQVSTQEPSLVSKGSGFWAKVATNSNLKMTDLPSNQSSQITYNIQNGWNLFSATKDIQISKLSTATCIDAIYKYNNKSWQEYDKQNSNNTLSQIKQNEGFWIKANGTCNITI